MICTILFFFCKRNVDLLMVRKYETNDRKHPQIIHRGVHDFDTRTQTYTCSYLGSAAGVDVNVTKMATADVAIHFSSLVP
jgi:hypothetical protein